MKVFDKLDDLVKPLETIVENLGSDDSIEKLAAEFLEDSNDYIPMDVKKLKRSSYQYSRLSEGLVIWNTPYAKRLFYNPQYNFRKDRNPNARGLWAEYAKDVNGDKYKNMINEEFEASKRDVFS